jgi:hypothetical protein
MNNNVGGDHDRLTDWVRPLARGLAIYSLTRQLKTQPSSQNFNYKSGLSMP